MGVARRSGGLSTERPGGSLPNFTPNTRTPFPEELRGDCEPMDAGTAVGQSLRNAEPGKISQGNCLRPWLQAGFPLLTGV